MMYSQIRFENITPLLSLKEFEEIKNFVLTNGDRKTFRNFDNHNPHFSFGGFEVFLGADVGQKNINNDPALSDFNQLTIVDPASEARYYELVLVRKDALKEGKAWIREGMEEELVYLVSLYGKDIGKMKNRIPDYIEQIKTIMYKHK
jgi:hypothetical protein